MGITKFKPLTPTLRTKQVMNSKDLTKNFVPSKKLLAPKKSIAGRNNAGRITVRHRGGGVKRKYRIIDFKRNKLDIPATIKAIAYDPNRTCNIALAVYADGATNFILAPLGLSVGDVIISSVTADIKVGNSKLLSDMPIGTLELNQIVVQQSDKLVTLIMKKLTAVKLVSRESLVLDQLFVV